MASPRGKSTLVARLKRLESDQFENLTYDILFLSGVQNLRWRTPSHASGESTGGQAISPHRNWWRSPCRR